MGWIDYWDGKPTIYVSRRHREAHCRSVADGIIAHLERDGLTVLDFGCGEALFAAEVASRCRHLYLSDGAPSVRADLERRLGATGNIGIVAPEGLSALAAGSVDLVVVNSVAQYLGTSDLAQCIDAWKRLLASGGHILIADIIPRSVGPATDALALLRFAFANGFLIAAMAGLARTAFSNYRQIRATLGLRQFEEAELIELLASHGLEASRVYPNLGHNQSRMAFIATLGHPRTTTHSARGRAQI